MLAKMHSLGTTSTPLEQKLWRMGLETCFRQVHRPNLGGWVEELVEGFGEG